MGVTRLQVVPCPSLSSCCIHGCATRMSSGERQRSCKKGQAKGLPNRKVASRLGSSPRLFCGRQDINTKARGKKKKSSKATPVAILHHALKNESSSGIEMLSVHLYFMHHVIGAEQKQVERHRVDVMGSDFP